MRYKFLINLICFSIYFLQAFSQPAIRATEMRAVWIATIDNIDWPERPTTNSEELKASFIRLLDLHQSNGMNTLIVQIRPAADALYPSAYEPWSQWLTGKQGQPPIPLFDPLEFMIAETHKRGMEFHAWLNPYRAVFNVYNASIASDHVTNLHPEWFVTYGDKKYFDPSNKDAQHYVVDVVKDVVKRYKVDAIHIDDYFYPYPIPEKPFPDAAAYVKYGKNLSLEDWRRSNVDSIIYQLHAVIKQTNPDCQFGVSPFGVWRNIDKDPRGSKTKAGPTNYDYLYADILLWLQKGWVDYVAPQLYWEIGHKVAPFEVLVDWWSKNTYGKNCYIGLAIYRTGTNKAWSDSSQLTRQMDLIRQNPNIQGMIFYSSKSFEKNRGGLNEVIRLNYFNTPAAPPKIK